MASAQPDTQLWGELTFSWIKSHRLTYGFDVEPKVLVSAPDGDPGWATLDLTPSIEYSHGAWLDVLGETLIGRTRQTDDLNSTEVTPRIGLRLHYLSNLRNELLKEKQPKRRFVLRDLLRLEWRNLYYSTDKPDSSSLRIRSRIETSYAITRPRITEGNHVRNGLAAGLLARDRGIRFAAHHTRPRHSADRPVETLAPSWPNAALEPTAGSVRTIAVPWSLRCSATAQRGR
jgi:hypothetical protein